MFLHIFVFCSKVIHCHCRSKTSVYIKMSETDQLLIPMGRWAALFYSSKLQSFYSSKKKKKTLIFYYILASKVHRPKWVKNVNDSPLQITMAQNINHKAQLNFHLKWQFYPYKHSLFTTNHSTPKNLFKKSIVNLSLGFYQLPIHIIYTYNCVSIHSQVESWNERRGIDWARNCPLWSSN